jgi:hypothetical protein
MSFPSICHVLLSERSQAPFSSSTVPDFVYTRQVRVFQALLLRFQFCVRAPGQAPALQSCLESSDSPARFRLVVISVIWLQLKFFIPALPHSSPAHSLGILLATVFSQLVICLSSFIPRDYLTCSSPASSASSLS